MRDMATCPGCGDRGDVEHVAACAGQLLREVYRVAFEEGAGVVKSVISKQLRRRGYVDMDGVESATANLAPGVGAMVRARSRARARARANAESPDRGDYERPDREE